MKDEVEQAKNEFLKEVNRLNYAITLMNTEPRDLSHSVLTSAVRGVVKSYEDFINSKIEFTDEYFKNK